MFSGHGIEPGLGKTARFPGVNESAEGEEKSERHPAAQRPLARDRNAGAPKEIKRRFAPEHGEDDVVRQRRLVSVLQEYALRFDPRHLRCQAPA